MPDAQNALARRGATAPTTRRALVKGAAWALPTASIALAAPAYALSAECVPDSATAMQSRLAFASGFPRWTVGLSSSDAVAPEYKDPYTPGAFNASQLKLAQSAVVEKDPPSGKTMTATMTSAALCLGPGTYVFSFDSLIYNANPRTARLRADVVDAGSLSSLGATVDFMTSTTSNNVSSRSDRITVTVSQRTQVNFRFRWSFDNTDSGTGDDIAVNAPKVSFSA